MCFKVIETDRILKAGMCMKEPSWSFITPENATLLSGRPCDFEEFQVD